MSPSPRQLALVLTTTIAIAPLTARGGPKEDAQPHIDRATQAHADGQFAVALNELKTAYQLDPQPELLYAIGQVYVKLDNCPIATEYYERFLATLPDAEAESEIRGAIAACKGRKAAPGSDPTSQPPPPPPAAPAPGSEPIVEAPQPAIRIDPPERWYKDRLGGALVIGGTVTTLVGVLVYRAAASDLDSAEAAGTLAGYTELVDAAHTKRAYSVILIGGGLALAGAGVVRYVLHARGTETHDIAVIPVDRDGGLVTWSGRF